MGVRNYEPDVLVAGDSWSWRRPAQSGFDVNTWNLVYRFVGSCGNFTFAAGVENGAYLVSQSPSDTEVGAGDYKWQAYISDGTDRYTVATGFVEIEEDLSSSDVAVSHMPQVKRQLDALQAMLTNKASKDQLSMSIAGRSISRLSPDEILKWQKVLRDEYKQLQIKARRRSGQRASNKIRARL